MAKTLASPFPFMLALVALLLLLAGPAILAGNHSGVIPMDAAMVWMDLITRPPKPILLRAVVDNFSGFLPWLGTIFWRCGQIVRGEA